jgi:cytochrome c biogenesis protein CcdA/thiol-disulfide isomerase/thioredoxin
MILLLFFAFLSGLVTIFAPCIWPLLPIILSSTATGGHKKPLGITLGIMLSFGFLTLSIAYLVRIIPFDPNALRYVAVIIIALLGISLIVPKFSGMLEVYVSKISGKLNIGNRSESTGFRSGFITGSALGVVWAPCAGPILATIATLAATQSVNLSVILIAAAYVIGVGIPLFIFSTIGKYIFTRSRVLSKYTGRMQQVFGVIMIFTALSIATNYDKVVQVKLLNAFPQLNSTLNSFENNNAIRKQLDQLRKKPDAVGIETENQSGLFNTNTPAPDFTGGTKWLNGQKALSISGLKGKVVLIDFWTYTCINCIRTLPHVTSWYDKYKNEGFVVVGVHTPEFQFEHDTKNVLNAIKMFNIHYPVVQDNDYAIWNSYSNQYWPAEYLIDANGNVRRTHFGEGEYEEMEMAIQTLLKEKGAKIDSGLEKMLDQTPKMSLSPETYLGSDRMQFYYPNGNTGNVNQEFKLSENIPQDSFSLGGQWDITAETAIAVKNAVLDCNFFADKVFLVLRPGVSKNSKVKIFLDGKAVDSSNAGSDIQNGEIIIDSDRLYNLIDLKGNPGNHLLKLEFQDSGTEAFAFTFG